MLPAVKVPRFTMILPHTKKEISYRPYLVKEEKLLIMAAESDSVDAALTVVGDLVRDCTNGEIDIDRDPMFDVQYAFLNIRGKSQGESIDLRATCTHDEHENFVSITVDDFTLQYTDKHENKIKVSDDTFVQMRYPTFKDFMDLYEKDTDEVFDVVARCIEKIWNEDETFINDGSNPAEFRAFIDNLTPEQFEQFEQFFVTMPILQCKKTYTCLKCKQQNVILIDGITNFFD